MSEQQLKTHKKMKHKSCQEVWGRCLQIISDNIPSHSFKTWFIPIKPVKLENKVLTLEVPSHFFYEFIEENFIDLLKKVLSREIGEGAKLDYSIVINRGSNNGKVVVPSDVQVNTQNRPVDNQQIKKNNSVQNPFVIPGVQKVVVDSNLQKKYSFDNFIVGDCNRVVREAGIAISKNPGGTPFNPLFIYSKSGLGKTHVSQAIGLETKRLFPEKTVLYLSASLFKTQYMQAVVKNTLNDFLHFYQMIDVLIIDDIQELTTPKTQQIFFQIFNHLHQSSKQLILTSDRAPSELGGMDERLLSRFKWGLSVELLMPDFETRKAIFEHKAKQEGIVIDEKVVDYICTYVNSNIRVLEGVLVSIIAHATIGNKKVDLSLAEGIVNQMIKKTKREITIPLIKKTTSGFYNISEEDMAAKTRRREVVEARQVAMYLSREITQSSLASIGAQIGNKNHATVLHACKTIVNLMQTNKKFSLKIEQIKRLLED